MWLVVKLGVTPWPSRPLPEPEPEIASRSTRAPARDGGGRVSPRKVINRRVRYEAEHAARGARGPPLLPVRDVPRHGREPAHRVDHRRDGGGVARDRRPDQCRATRPARTASWGRCTAQGEPGRAVHRAASGVVLPVPVRAPADLQDPCRADPRHHHHPDDLDGAARGLAVPRPRPRPAAVAAAVGRRRRPRRAGVPDRADDRRHRSRRARSRARRHRRARVGSTPCPARS